MKCIIAICVLLLPVCFGEYQERVSILNVGTGYSPYIYWDNPDNVIGFNFPSTLGGFKRQATWWKIQHKDGTFSFKDFLFGYCIQFNGIHERVIQNPCDFTNKKMQFDIQQTLTGSYVISFISNGHCLYGSPDYIKAGPCEPYNSDFRWKFIDPIYNI